MHTTTDITGQGSPSVLKIKDVCSKIGVSRTTLFEMIRTGSFPEPIEITRKRRGLLAVEVEAWLVERASARRSSRDANQGG